MVQNNLTDHWDWYWTGTLHTRQEAHRPQTSWQGRQAPAKRHDHTHSKHWPLQGSELGVVCVKGPECDVALFARPCFDIYHSQRHFWRLTLNWKSRTHRHKWMFPCNNRTDILHFSVAVSYDIRGKGSVEFTKGFRKKNIVCLGGSLCVFCLIFHLKKVTTAKMLMVAEKLHLISGNF